MHPIRGMEMNDYEKIQVLLTQKAEKLARVKLIPFDGSIEVKEINGEKYIYARKRVGGKNKSTYLDVYSDTQYDYLSRQAQELRALKRELRQIDRALSELGYSEEELSPRVMLNIDFARANVKSLIYDQAVLEGISTTFPQTDAILENGIVNGVRAQDVQKILNLKHAWEFILDKDVLQSKTDYYLLARIAGMVNEGFYFNGGSARSVPVTIGGTTYVPPLPVEADVKEDIAAIMDMEMDSIDKAIELCLYCMKTQIFIDGNKRASIIFANHYMIQNGEGLLVVPESKVEEFKRLLVSYYEGMREDELKQFFKEQCWRQF
ncbi:MAG: Fic family protein [Emergencia sp.]|nr:Fic family protein [Emergencia sp.]